MNKVLTKSIQTYNQNLFKARVEHSIVFYRECFTPTEKKSQLEFQNSCVKKIKNVAYIMFDVFPFVDVCRSINMKYSFKIIWHFNFG